MSNYKVNVIAQARSGKSNQPVQHQLIIERIEESDIQDDSQAVKVEYISYDDLTNDKNVCTNCFAAFQSPHILMKHVLDQHTPKISCELCDRQFKSKTGLSLHMIQQHTASYFECIRCQEQFRRRIELKKHLQSECLTVNGEETVCEFCTFVAISSKEMYKHSVMVHTAKYQPLKFIQCQKCTLAFREQEVYDEHQRYHQKIEGLLQQ